MDGKYTVHCFDTMQSAKGDTWCAPTLATDPTQIGDFSFASFVVGAVMATGVILAIVAFASDMKNREEYTYHRE